MTDTDTVMVSVRVTRHERRVWQAVARMRGFDSLSAMLRDYMEHETALLDDMLPRQVSLMCAVEAQEAKEPSLRED